MKNLLTFAIALMMCSSTTGQGMEFFHGKWEDALKMAQDQNKLIFVDAYTTWCGPCKRMSAQVFPQPEVGAFYNTNFINVKMNMEDELGRKFGRKYPVSAYPTFFWIDPDGNVVYTTKGARKVEDFLALGELAAKKFDGSAKYKTFYDAGERDFETVYNYIIALNKGGKSSVKVANEYFRTQDDLTTEENLKMLIVATTRVDSKIFAYLEENKKALEKQEGRDAVDETIRKAAYNTTIKAIEYESPELIDEGVAAMKKHLPPEAGEYEVSSRMQYALYMEDVKTYAPNAKIFIKKYAGEDEEELTQVALDVLEHFSDHDACNALGQKAAKKAMQIQRNERNIIAYATLVYLDGDKEGALEVLDEAMESPDFEGASAKKLSLVRKQLEAA